MVYKKDIKILTFEDTSTVAKAAESLGVTPGEIAKSLLFKLKEDFIMILMAGDKRIDNRKFKDLFKAKAKMPEAQTVRRGLAVDDWLHLNGAQGIYALGDASATKYAPTAQVASQQGKYLARLFSQLAACDKLEEEVKTMEDGDEKEKKLRKLQKAKAIKPFEYSHQGSLA